MRYPRRSRDEVLAQNEYLIIADCNMLVRTESGKMFNWRTLWFYDPSANAWICDEPVIASNNDATTIF